MERGRFYSAATSVGDPFATSRIADMT
jgi:hypothetical protein